MTEEMTLSDLIKKRNELRLKLSLGQARNSGELIKIKREIARKKSQAQRLSGRPLTSQVGEPGRVKKKEGEQK